MKVILKLFLITVVCGCTTNLNDIMTDKQKISEQKAIEKVIARYVDYWNANDMESWGKLFTEDVDYVNRGGGWWPSNQENIEGHKQIHKMMVDNNQKMAFSLDVRKVSFLKPDIALVHVLSEWPEFKSDSTGQKAHTIKGILSLLVVKKENEWLIRALHNTLREENSP